MCKALDELCRRNRESGVSFGQEKERVTNILSLMDSLHLPPAKAMELLKIPTDEQEKYLQLVAQQGRPASSESCGRLPE